MAIQTIWMPDLHKVYLYELNYVHMRIIFKKTLTYISPFYNEEYDI